MKAAKVEMPSCEDCPNKGGMFSCLSREDKAVLGEDKGNNYYKKGQVIFYEGNYPHGLYCIFKGKVKVSKLGDEGKEQIVRISGNADTLGYRSLLCNEPYKATATALEDSYVCYLSKKRFFELMESNNTLCLSTIQLLARELRQSEQQLVDITQKTVRERIAEVLLQLKNKFGFKPDGRTIDIRLTRREIGDMAGVTTETTIRTLSELNKSGVIAIVGKDIQVLKLDQLLLIANIDD
ncbi:MAG: Crp/Fnr family transcriptional regulator [Crocinitomicaceae bacterium]|jgi:CRP-like cAMP-binding protein|nr:Crp/Fnr family transcriptional regulator [Crocinitomicaceae bacterium]MBK6953698.1 Crp/Fnr family transcriptional regulator [Crocinitomicaceae bacterium]MBK9593445.1 Crp/Fnr family transcriptional regulator [Crocinitomicaceae bacterium]